MPPPQIKVVADPRRRDDQYELLRWLLPYFETYYAQCRAEGTFPQFWVSSEGALGHLDTLADRLRPVVVRIGDHLLGEPDRGGVEHTGRFLHPVDGLDSG